MRDSSIRVRPRDKDSLVAWQFTGQPWGDWPMWVQDSCVRVNDVLRHNRLSGAQLVYKTEWLVKSLDGAVDYYTDEEFRREFESQR